MKKKKKWIFVVLALVLVAGLGYFLGQGRQNELMPKTQKASSAPEIKYISVAGAEGLTVEAKVIIDHWQRGILSLTVSVKNTRSSMLIQGLLTRTFIEASGTVRGIRNEALMNYVRGLKPGETRTFELEMLEFQNVSSIKKIEISFAPWSIMWDSASFPVGEPEQINEEPEPTEQSPGIQVYTATDYPKNPKTPGEVVAAFTFLFYEKKYKEAEEFLSQATLQSVRAAGGLKNWYDKIFKGRQLEKIELREGRHDSETYYLDFVTLWFKDGSSERDEEVELVKENGRYKIK